MVPFSGWEMPVQYSSIIEEHRAVRERAGLFDVSHMGEIIVEGDNALAFLENLTCNTVSSIEDGQVQYNAVLNDQGGIIDDITIYRTSKNTYFIVSNAANYAKVFAHFQKQDTNGVTLRDESDDWCLLALQGPNAAAVMKSFDENLTQLAYFHFVDIKWREYTVRISRTGYTGTDGFEMYAPASTAAELWNLLLKEGESHGVQPAGLGARDILRLEAGMALWGNELNEEWTPVQSNINFIVKEKTPPYLGYDRIMGHKADGPPGKVVRFVMTEKGGVPRSDFPVYGLEGAEPIGKVLSGAHSPVLGTGIGTAYLPAEFIAPDTEITIGIRDRKLRARLHRGPFIQKTSGKV